MKRKLRKFKINQGIFSWPFHQIDWAALVYSANLQYDMVYGLNGRKVEVYKYCKN